MKKLILSLLALVWLSGCATTSGGQDIGEKYQQNLKVVQTCMFNSIMGILSVPRTGFEGFYQVCSDKPGNSFKQ